MDIYKVEDLFLKKFYNPAYRDWKIKGKSGKDIIGARYEDFRKSYYLEMGFDVSENHQPYKIGYNADVVVKLHNKIVIMEESKGHYIDSCFLKRAITNAAEIFLHCLENKFEIPYFILSCSTRNRNYSSIFENSLKLYNSDIKDALLEKFIYFPLCKHDRISSKEYFKTEENCFILDDDLISYQNNYIKKIMNGNTST